MERTRFRLIVATTISVVVCTAIPGSASIIGMSVVPEDPVEGDTVILTVKGLLGDACWRVDSTSSSQESGRFLIDLFASVIDTSADACAQIVTDYTVCDTLVGLPMGAYTFIARELVRAPFYPWPYIDSVAFTVSKAGTGSNDISLHLNYPNPFNAATQISFDMPQAGHVTIHLFDVLGRRVRTLADQHYSVGSHTAMWDGTDESGHPLSSGVYFVRVSEGENAPTLKMVLLR